MSEKLFVISNIYPSKKFPERGVFVKNIYEILEDSDIEIRKIVLKVSGYSNFTKLFNYCVFYLRIFFLSTFSSSILYVHYVSHCALPISILMFFLRKNVIVNVHGTDILGESIINSLLQPFISYILQNCNGIVVPSSFFKRILLKKYNLKDESRFHISPSGGIDQSLFLNSSLKQQKKEDLTLGFISRIEEKKGWKLFLNSILRLKEKGISIRGIMVGTGSDSNRCSDAIDSLGLRQDVEFYSGVKQDKLPEYYKRLDMFVFPTFYDESLGLVALEAMAMGIPVVASNKGAIPEYLFNGENGYLFSAGNLGELVKCISQYSILSLKDRKRLSKNAMKTASKYSQSEIKDDLISFLHSKI